ncbi:D-Ala-D-Ala carboxypeptidase family metallohydrolase [Neolewinella persica]|uniref:D-Ala-D-Ala carboxypeptidase family metallohydrolase n=1 Tax=Neolewinella persica TaxID=70998 RepID=UPI0003A165D2|nr:D-Ala-D-Ala carboxypeptidase family metallohydrolase [Neolewinella persica]
MTKDRSIATEEDINQILSEFPVVNQADLPTDFLLRTRIDAPAFRHLSPRKFFVIRKKDLYRKVTGHLRIHHLFALGAPARKGFYFSDDLLYWGIDPDILHKLLELRLTLENEGYDGEAFSCNYGYRHPALNAAVGGAPYSRHIAGDALDLVIGDVNQDGQTNAADKAIVLNLCERKLIGNRGGIGRYPGTQVVHIDLRGKRARWDSY